MSQLHLEGEVGVFLARNGRKGIGDVGNTARGCGVSWARCSGKRWAGSKTQRHRGGGQPGRALAMELRRVLWTVRSLWAA